MANAASGIAVHDDCRQRFLELKAKRTFRLLSPDTIRVRTKMIYASSKARFKRELDGIQLELQATDPTEMDLDVIRSQVV
ncbi:hypothetical protein MKX01_001480 [Papaver californicum]|nr:hypothetical protein MKX01_001480 [Papaver californicum]